MFRAVESDVVPEPAGLFAEHLRGVNDKDDKVDRVGRISSALEINQVGIDDAALGVLDDLEDLRVILQAGENGSKAVLPPLHGRTESWNVEEMNVAHPEVDVPEVCRAPVALLLVADVGDADVPLFGEDAVNGVGQGRFAIALVAADEDVDAPLVLFDLFAVLATFVAHGLLDSRARQQQRNNNNNNK